MNLGKYKTKYKVNIQDLASDFGVPHQTIYYWIKTGAEIRGKKGEREIVLEKTLRREVAKEVE